MIRSFARVLSRSSLLVCLVVTSFLGNPLFLQSEVGAETVLQYTDDMQVMVGDIEVIKVQNLQRLSITNPEIADITDAKSDEVSIFGQSPGETTLFIWDDLGKRTTMIRVVPEELEHVKTRLKKILENADITGLTMAENEVEGYIVITGTLPETKKETFDGLIAPFEGKVMNLVKQEVIEDMIQIDMQITELSTTLLKSMGFKWTSSLGYSETLPTSDGDFEDLFRIGDFNRTTAIVAAVNALIQEGKGRVLSKPRIVVKNGKEASFLVGGEIPVTSTTLNAVGSSVTENISYKSYGVSMLITPTINSIENKIDIILNVEISDIDPGNSIGNQVAFVTRSATTQLYLDNGQTIVLAGLIKKSETVRSTRIPGLSRIPVVGLLFRHKETPAADTDTEVVISLTPTILKVKSAAAEKLDTNKASRPAVKKMGEDPLKNFVAYQSEETHSNGIRDYAEKIQNRISSAVTYPFEAQENGWEGVVKITLRVLKDGTLGEVLLKESSGFDVFDEDALHTAQVLSPYAPFPSEMDVEELIVTVPIVYSQNRTF